MRGDKTAMSIIRVVGVAALAGLAVVIGACSSANPSNLGDCHDGVAGCSCDQSGQTAACGTELSQTETTVTCSMGKSTCNGKTWSVCAGDHIETKSKPGQQLTAGGLTTLGQTVPCSNLCDPNECHSYQDGPNDVDAAGVSVTDAGLQLTQGDGGGGGPCTGLKCNVANCGVGKTTSISGFVYDPASANPLYNVYVYVPLDATGKIASLPTGASQIQCSNQTTISAVTVTQTAVDGSFTLTGVPSGVNIPLVMQSGQWRREIMLKSSAVTQCVNNTISTSSCVSAISTANCALRLPKNHTDGYDWNNGLYDFADVPQLAIVTGNADPFECLLLKMGIDPLEFGSTTSNSTRRIHFFESPDDPGTVLASTYGNRVTGDQLWNTNSILKNYAAILLPCEGAAVDKMNNPKTGVPKTSKPPGTGVNPYSNLIGYTNNGGRVFATHYSYVWLEYPGYFSYVSGDNWSAVATWDHAYNSGTSTMNTSTYATQDPLPATIDQSFTKGAAFAQWLLDVGASSTLGTLNLHEARHDVVTLGTTTQDWSVANDSASGVTPTSYNPSFTYNTPYPALPANQYGRVVFSDFHVSSNALANTNLQSQCTANSDCGFTQTCNGYVASTPGNCTEPCYTANDCANTSYTCSGATLGTCGMKACTKKNQCGGGNCGTNGICQCTANSQCQSGVCSAGVCKATSCGGTCGGAEACNGGTTGTCTKSCATSSDCGGGELCVDSAHKICSGGTCSCTGCLNSTQCSSKLGGSTCGGVGPTTYGTCSPGMPNNPPSNSNGWFPYACANQPMIAQEQALEFMFFDLTSCVAPDNGLPPGPPPYKSATFTQDFTGTCPSGQSIAWREFDWQADIPSGTNIVFAAQSGPNTSGLLNASPVSLATATASTNLPSYDAAIIDTATGGTTTGTGPFNKASPPIRSDTLLRITITMNPDTNGTITPTLKSWKVQYDCTASQ
jgi:hypothetical protein